MNKIMLFVNLMKDRKLARAYEIAGTLSGLGYEVYIMISEENADISELKRADMSHISFISTREQIEEAGIELVMVMGGDGSIIGYCRKYRDLDIPVIGINLGTLGFLPELSLENYERLFKDLKDDKIGYSIQERNGLYVEYEGAEDERLFAVNEVTLARGLRARIIEIEVYINGIYFETITADGILVATATGSTGYSLSAGGPILLPTSTDIIITPICPHSLSGRSIVVTKDDIVTLKMVSEARVGEQKAFMTVDGQDMYPLKTNSFINIKSRNRKIKYLVFDEEVFYKKLRDKMK